MSVGFSVTGEGFERVRPQEEWPSRCGFDAFANKAGCPSEFRMTGTRFPFFDNFGKNGGRNHRLVRRQFCFFCGFI